MLFPTTRTGLGQGDKADWAAVVAQGREDPVLRVGSWLCAANRPSIGNATMPEETSTASVSGEGGWFSGILCPLPVRGKAFFSLSHPNPLLVFPKYCSHNLRKLKGKNKGFDRVFLPNRLLHSPKPAQEKLPPSGYSPLWPHETPLLLPKLSRDRSSHQFLSVATWPLPRSVHAYA